MTWTPLAELSVKGDKGDKGDQGIVPPTLIERLATMEEIASEPGSRTVNLIADPKPVDPATTYQTGRIRTVSAPAPSWARAVADGTGANSIRPLLQNGESIDIRTAVTPGQDIGFGVTLRAMEGVDISATVNLEGYAAGAMKGNILSDGQHTMAALEVRRFSAVGKVPDGIDQVRLFITFRTRGESFALSGHSLYWREASLYVGNVPAGVPYTTGDGENAYWLGDPNKSASVSMKPRTSSGGTTAGTDAFRRDAIVDAGLKRRGGVIGTNGLPAVALRFDHHLPNFKSKVLPLLKQYRLPWGQMLNAGRIADGSEGMTFAEFAAECYTSGGEAWNHSYSHTDMPDAATADREIIRGFDELTAGLPGLYIDGFVGPGQTNMMGMEGSETPERFWGTYPGRLVMARHAFIQGHYPGYHLPLGGPNLIGAGHQTIDTLDAARVGSSIRGVMAARAGLIFMLHPNYLDTPGYMTTADLSSILSSIAAYRDAGQLLVLTPTAILMADISKSYRRNLLTTGAAGSTTAWTETVNGRSGQTQYGVPHELVVTVKAKTAGTVQLVLQESAAPVRFDSQHSKTLAVGETATLRCLATLPRDCAGIVAKLTGDVEHTGIELHAV